MRIIRSRDTTTSRRGKDMLDRSALEQAAAILEEALEADESSEAYYQKLLEEYPVVFTALGYSRALPKLRFDLPDGKWLEPDFMAQNKPGIYEVFEIKTPQEKLVKPVTHRTTFYSPVHEYISQAHNYSEYFDDAANRAMILAKYNLDIQKKPDMLLLAGRDAGTDKKELHLLCRRAAASLTILTFDDLLNQLKTMIADVRIGGPNLPGATILLLVLFQRHPLPRKKYVFDAGMSLGANRLSVYIDATDNLCFEVHDRNATPYTVRVPFGTNGLEFEQFHHIYCEYGTSDKDSFVQLFVDNRSVAHIHMNHPIPLSSQINLSQAVIGADIHHSNNGKFRLAEFYPYSQTHSYRDRFRTFAYFIDKYHSEGQAETPENPAPGN